MAARDRACQVVAAAGGSWALAIGVTTLLGWATGRQWLTSFGGGLVATAPHTALALVLLGSSSLLLLSPTHRGAVQVGRALGSVAAAAGAFFLLEYLLGAGDALDSLFFPDSLAAAAYSQAGRPAPNTALCILLGGLSLVLVDTGRSARWRLGEWLALAMMLVAVQALLGYAFGAMALYRVSEGVNPMALSTAVALLGAAAGAGLSRPGRGLLRLLNGDDVGGRLARALLPAAFLVPTVLGMVSNWAERAALVGDLTADSVVELATSVLFGVLVLLTAAALSRAQARRRDAEQELRARESQLRHRLAEIEAIYASAPVGLCVLDPDLRFVRINARLAEMNGLSREAHVGRSIHEIVPELAPVAEPLMRGVLETGEPVLNLELSGETKAEPAVLRHWVEHFLPIRDIDGRIVGLNVVAEDVTEPKRALAALHASEERYRQLVAQAAVGIAQAGADARLTAVNPGFCRILAYEADELLGRAVQELTDPADVEREEAEVRRVLAGECDGYTIEKRFLRSDGRRVWCDVTTSAVRDAEGRLAYAVAIVQDIEARRAAELERESLIRELDLEREQLRTVLEVAPAGIAVLEGPEHVIRSANATLRRYSALREIVGATVRDAFPALLGEGLFERMDAVYGSGEPFSAQEMPVHRLARADDHAQGTGADPHDVTYWNLECQPLRDADGRIFGLLLHTADVTERVRARLAAEESSRAKSQFLAVMSHEFRTPLGAIIGYTDLLEAGAAGALEARQRDHLARIKATAWHLNSLVEQILTFSRAEAGRLDITPEWVDAAALARDVAALLEPQASARGLRLELQLAADPLPLETDAGKLRQILLNLLGNAVKFTEQGQVALQLGTADDELVVQVADTGPGIPAAHHETIFELFNRPGGAPRTAGAGIGLPLSRQLARLLGGSLTVASEPGRGSTFTLRLPLRAPAELRAE